ncbi:hypothetical protein CROQUDRAFT_712822 [Cronartium quercuum f. sp. fusiforme G11]|uniref:Uncharacterized protein n=1 Tax=Cronartium quercuum f. sp. fusiforme G11 TaxID=708437 RepID=A0A9P6NWJ6_9BASI|nr:hypothetical protein CROQUDRAFT_712822 [Cronartium quercuum f. sp. fusiforme G11]
MRTASATLLLTVLLSFHPPPVTEGRQVWPNDPAFGPTANHALQRRRFSQESLSPIGKIADLPGCPGQICGVLAGGGIAPLLARADECAQQFHAEKVIAAALDMTNGINNQDSRNQMIEIAIKYRAAERNTAPYYQASPAEERNSVYCQVAPKFSQLAGIVQAQNPANNPMVFFDPKVTTNSSSVLKGSQPNTFPFGPSPTYQWVLFDITYSKQHFRVVYSWEHERSVHKYLGLAFHTSSPFVFFETHYDGRADDVLGLKNNNVQISTYSGYPTTTSFDTNNGNLNSNSSNGSDYSATGSGNDQTGGQNSPNMTGISTNQTQNGMSNSGYPSGASGPASMNPTFPSSNTSNSSGISSGDTSGKVDYSSGSSFNMSVGMNMSVSGSGGVSLNPSSGDKNSSKLPFIDANTLGDCRAQDGTQVGISSSAGSEVNSNGPLISQIGGSGSVFGSGSGLGTGFGSGSGSGSGYSSGAQDGTQVGISSSAGSGVNSNGLVTTQDGGPGSGSGSSYSDIAQDSSGLNTSSSAGPGLNSSSFITTQDGGSGSGSSSGSGSGSGSSYLDTAQDGSGLNNPSSGGPGSNSGGNSNGSGEESVSGSGSDGGLDSECDEPPPEETCEDGENEISVNSTTLIQ